MKLWIAAILLIVNQCHGALRFNGTSSFVNFGDSDALDGLGKLGIMAWVYMDSTCPNFSGLFCDITPTALDNGWTVQRSVGNVVFVGFRNASGVGHATTPDGSFSSNAWHHLVVNYDGAGAANADRLKVFIDGVNQTLDFVGTVPATFGANSAPFYIGTYDSTVAGSFWIGFVDDVVFSTGRVLMDSEMSIHRLGKVRRMTSSSIHIGLDGYPDGLVIPNGSAIYDDGPNQYVGKSTNCIAAASLFMTYP